MQLKEEVLNMMRGDTDLHAKIMLVSGASSATVYRWIQKNNVMLTTAGIIRVISDHLHLPQSELFEPVEPIQV